jgi:hypothetical protein
VRHLGSASLAITSEMLPQELHNARVEIAVKGGPVEARRHVGERRNTLTAASCPLLPVD